MLWRRLTALVLALGLVGTGSAIGLPTGKVSADDVEQQVVTLVNLERAKQGVAPLTVSSELTVAARAYAQQLATQRFLSHVAPDGTTFDKRDEAAGYRGWTYLEENLAAGQTSPAQAVAAWMASPPHREDILSPNVRETGVGYYVLPGSPYVYYWVQEFGSRPGVDRLSFTMPSPTWHAPTGHDVSGDWLDYVEGHGFVD